MRSQGNKLLGKIRITDGMCSFSKYFPAAVEEEKKRRKEVEQQLAVLQNEKRAAITAVTAEKDSQLENARLAGEM